MFSYTVLYLLVFFYHHLIIFKLSHVRCECSFGFCIAVLCNNRNGLVNERFEGCVHVYMFLLFSQAVPSKKKKKKIQSYHNHCHHIFNGSQISLRFPAYVA